MVKISPEGVSLFLTNIRQSIVISNDYWLIYQKFNGIKDLYTIYIELSDEWDIDKEEMRKFILFALDRKFMDLLDKPILNEIVLNGDPKTYYPSVISIELTNKCNIKCIYCYGYYHPHNKDIIEFDKLEEMLKFFHTNGSSIIEFTGGEPLLHPRFIEVCELALVYFPSITILSNGALFTEGHFEIINNNINRISLQISIDGITEQTNHLVRGVPNTWLRTFNTIKRLIGMNAVVRIVYMLTKINAHEVKAACELMRSLGVKNGFSINPAMNIGRGHNSDCSIMNDIIIDKEYDALFEDIEKNYSDVLITIQKNNEKSVYFLKDEQKNCGAGWKTVGISADGNVKACHLLDENAIIGNIYTNNYKSIFSSHKTVNFFQKFQKDTDDKRCEGCSFEGHCAKCIFKVYEANKRLLAEGRDLCPVAKENEMDVFLNFNEQVN